MSERGYVLDASALLAILFQEAGAARAEEVWSSARISAVNFSEAVAKLHDRKLDGQRIDRIVASLEIEVIPVDRQIAIRAGALRPVTRHLGLSLGDRACLATAEVAGLVALTADRAWAKLDIGIAVEVLR